MKILKEKQYAAFAENVKTLDSLRRNEVSYVPGVFEVAKVIILSKEDFEKLSEDVSPEYPFLKDNREIMSADPGGLFRADAVQGTQFKDRHGELGERGEESEETLGVGRRQGAPFLTAPQAARDIPARSPCGWMQKRAAG